MSLEAQKAKQIIIDEIKESVRLGQDMERDGFLKPVRIAETIKTIKMRKIPKNLVNYEEHLCFLP